MFWRKRNKKTNQQENKQEFGEPELAKATDLASNIYTVSEEDLSPGFEEVYVPFLVVLLDGEEVLVFARFIDGTTMLSLEEASDEVIEYVERRYAQGRLAYRRLACDSLSAEEEQALDRVEKQLQRRILKKD